MESKITLGELVAAMDAGQATRDDVKAAVEELSADGKAIHWGATVRQPQAEVEVDEPEIELG
jgi:hypothetical protein